MIKRIFILSCFLFVAMVFTGCATPSNFLSADEITHEVLVNMVCDKAGIKEIKQARADARRIFREKQGNEPWSEAERKATAEAAEKARKEAIWKCKDKGEVMPEEVKILRSRFIAGAIGNYGANTVEEYSGQRAEGDATLILTHLQKVLIDLNEQEAKLNGPKNKFFNYEKYKKKVSKLIDVAIQPAKRYYEDKITGFLGTGLTVEVAKTAGKAILRLFEIKGYKDAILKDVYDSIHDNTVQNGDISKSNDLLNTACDRLRDKAKDFPNPCEGLSI